ncbi:MAG: hypothetical protein K0Q72_1774 [Armatimonadetes bacterium]|jgi:hypothetical protein|nr:hypothetical protein [Armatimonadota bacterium]
MALPVSTSHRHAHAFSHLNALEPEGLVVRSRRNMLKAGLAGMAGLTLPGLLQQRAEAAARGKSLPGNRSVILLWMTGGPSHLDTWDPKPDRPLENRGPFGTIPTRLPGVRICEHLPLMAGMLDRFTLIRSVNARNSNHEPNTVFQTGDVRAEARTNPEARSYPAIGAICARHRGPNHPAMPPYVAFKRSDSHLAFGGYLGKQYDPFIGNEAARLPVYDLVGNDSGKIAGGNLLHLPIGLDGDRIRRRQSLRQAVDALRGEADTSEDVAALDKYGQRAVDLLLGGRAREAFDLSREPEAVRQRYGKHLWCQQALLARRLVEAGVSFVTLDLSYHTASGTWDNHGDNIPPYGGITSGLKPLLPLFDHLYTTLVSDLGERGLLDETLVIAMGEFGRTPSMTKFDGRDHWAVVMSMALAGGGLKHGQVIGATDPDGGDIAERPVTPGDLAATIYRHMGVPLEATYDDHSGRPIFIVQNGEPIRELF